MPDIDGFAFTESIRAQMCLSLAPCSAVSRFSPTRNSAPPFPRCIRESRKREGAGVESRKWIRAAYPRTAFSSRSIKSNNEGSRSFLAKLPNQQVEPPEKIIVCYYIYDAFIFALNDLKILLLL